MIHRYPTSVANALTDDALRSPVLPDLATYRQDVDTCDMDLEPAIHVDQLERLFTHAAESDLDKFETDAWLAPRLHYALRLPRRLAADRGLWTWLATEYAHPYVLNRWGGAENLQWRYMGPLTRNAVSRLWWAAELTRNGPDYSVTPHSVRRAGTAQYALELKYTWYRPAVIAFVRVAEGLGANEPLSFEATKRLSVRVNALTVLKPVEAVGFDPLAGEDDQDFDWYRHRPAFEEIVDAELPRGPDDSHASPEAIEALTDWFGELATMGDERAEG